MLYLQPRDFTVNRDGDLTVALRDFALVFFMSDKSDRCRRLRPTFERVANSVSGCQFAYMDVNQNNVAIKELSEQSSTPIEYVPLMILYANGKQLARFPPGKSVTPQDVKTWLVQATNRYAANAAPSQSPSSSFGQYGREENNFRQFYGDAYRDTRAPGAPQSPVSRQEYSRDPREQPRQPHQQPQQPQQPHQQPQPEPESRPVSSRRKTYGTVDDAYGVETRGAR